MAAIVHGRINENVCIRKKICFPIGKRMYCSCHSTWLLCEISIQRDFVFQNLVGLTLKTDIVIQRCLCLQCKIKC